MNLSRPFVRRPVASSLVAVGLVLVGALAYGLLPVSPLPQVDFPTIRVSASLPGASPETMAANVAALAPLRAAYERGERAVHRAISTVQVARVEVTEDEAANVNDQTTLADIAADMRSAR